jgi:hypothetical protein
MVNFPIKKKIEYKDYYYEYLKKQKIEEVQPI